MSPDELQLYRALFKALTPELSDLIVKYVQIQYNLAVKSVRTKCDDYDHGYNNGKADAYSDLANLRQKLLEIMKNVG